MESNKYRKLIAPRARQLTEEDRQEELQIAAYDNDIRVYRETREKFKAMKMKTNLDLM